MLRPALRRRQLDIAEARLANARDRLLDGVAMVAVGIHSDDALHAASLLDQISLVFTLRPVSEDSIAAKTARIAVNTLCASMPCTAGFFRLSTKQVDHAGFGLVVVGLDGVHIVADASAVLLFQNERVSGSS